MHELPVTESILEIAIRNAKNANATRIININIVIGQLATIVDESIQFYWDIISKDTIAEGAKLTFNRISAEMLCLSCNYRFAPDGINYQCPKCGSFQVKVSAGDEFYLDTIDIE